MYDKLVLSFALALMSGNAFTEEIQTSGICGETAADCSWSYENGTLKILGTGEMKNYESNSDRPWNKWAGDITQVEMSGITRVGTRALRGFSKITQITIPASVEVLGAGALQDLNLTNLTFEEGSTLKTINNAAFARVTALQILELPDSVESMRHSLFAGSSIVSLVLPESLFKDGKIGLSEYTFKNGMTLYCPKEHQQECEDYLKTAKTDSGSNVYVPLENTNLQTYEKDGDGYFINGSWYKHPNDVLTGKRIKKLRYTVEEAMKATEKGTKFHVFLTYK